MMLLHKEHPYMSAASRKMGQLGWAVVHPMKSAKIVAKNVLGVLCELAEAAMEEDAKNGPKIEG